MRASHRLGVRWFFVFVSLILPAALAQGFDGDICPSARPGAPELSYTLTSIEPGSLKSWCAPSAINALKNGFTLATIVPARIFDGIAPIANGTVPREEILDCLETVWSFGLNIVYQPHLESWGVVDPSKPAVWRALFDFAPAANYEKLMIDPIFEFMARHHDEIFFGRRHVNIVVAAELESSTAHFAASWWSVVRHSRQKLELIGLGGKVPVGYNPNWWPMAQLKGEYACENFRNFVGALDFIAPSLYGDWSKIFKSDGEPRGHAQVDENKSATLKRLSYYGDIKCDVPEVSSRSFVIGEFGVGGDPAHAEQSNFELMKKPDFVLKRRAIYANILDWAMGNSRKAVKASAAGVMPWINVWTGGEFDPVGVHPNETTITDPEISKMFTAYKNWRCNGAKKLNF